ncbi:MAG TPA: ABC transporter permease [Planctomycetaceae bacterium]|nr:ABC transporter permease [Planctomycetaceae bacterium]
MASSPRELQERSWIRAFRNEIGLAIAIVVVIAITLVFNQDYLYDPGRNCRDILYQTALLGIFSLGSAIVIISGGIDLSSGSVIALAGSVCALVMTAMAPIDEYGVPDTTNVGATVVAIAIVAAVLVGAMVGTLHAWLITVIRLPPFVATLASLVGLRSIAKIVNQAVTAELGNQQTKVRADDMTFGLLDDWKVALAVFLTLGVLCWLLMNRTVVGRRIYAMGGNEQAAKLCGIRTDQLKWLAYTISSVTASIAGVLYVAKIGAAGPSTLGVGYELNAIAASVVGGCSLQGGVGLIPGVMLGVLFLQVVIDSVAKVIRAGSDDYQGLIVGFLVVLAVAFNEWRQQPKGTHKELFPGAMGWCTIPILALLIGVITYVFNGRVAGAATGATVLVLLAAGKLLQSSLARPQKARSAS